MGRSWWILVDLERHRVVDLLPDRSADTVATWLGDHPDVKIVSRDRGGEYAEGVKRGAPAAIQLPSSCHPGGGSLSSAAQCRGGRTTGAAAARRRGAAAAGPWRIGPRLVPAAPGSGRFTGADKGNDA